MKRVLSRMIVGLLWVIAGLYAIDWTVWRVRVAMGNGMGTVTVGILIETPLKNGREEFDWGGEETVDCSRSLLPHAGAGACWWLAREKTIEEK